MPLNMHTEETKEETLPECTHTAEDMQAEKEEVKPKTRLGGAGIMLW